MISHAQLTNVIEEFLSKPIAFHRIYAKIAGSITGGLLLSQLLYWSRTMKHKPFYKTNEDFREELGMGLDEFKAAKRNLINLGLIHTELKGIPAKTYYIVDMEEITRQILDIAGHQLVGGNSTNCVEDNPPTTTENTRELPYIPSLEEESILSSRSLPRVLPLDSGIDSSINSLASPAMEELPLKVDQSQKEPSTPSTVKKTDPLTPSTTPDPSWIEICNHMLGRNDQFQHWTHGLKYMGMRNGKLFIKANNAWIKDSCEQRFGPDLLAVAKKLNLGVSYVEFYL